MNEPVIFYDSKSSAENDWKCGMAYWWSKCEGGVGIRPAQEASYFIDGRDLHADLEAFAKGASVQQAVGLILPLPSEATQIEREKHARRLGWISAWGLYIEPILRNFGEEVICEQELLLCRDPLREKTRPDRVQRRKSGGLVYREWKSTASTRSEWAEGWRYSVQLHIGLKALQEASGEEVEFGQVTGLYKGQERDGRLVHPYVWAYFKDGNWSSSYQRGWDHRPVWEYEGGPLEWAERCGREVADKMFVWSPPISLDNRLLDSFLRSRSARLQQVERVKSECQGNPLLRQIFFEQRFSECRPPYGEPCEFLAACHNATVNADPVRSGIYVKRTM